jgi:predicted Rossmann fold flavoprotein
MARKKLVVIGGGASGFFCAVNAARLAPTLDVLIVEKTNKLLSKVKISGGGRCNVTHWCEDVSEMSVCYPRGQHLLKKTLHHFFITDTIDWFAERGVVLKAEADGRMFPETNSSQTIIDCLLKEADKQKVQVLMNHSVASLTPETNSWALQFSTGETLKADYVCIACGGYPKASQFEWITKLGHTIEEPVPSLFTFNTPNNPITALMGLSVKDVQVKIVGSKLEERGPLLITHWGQSGPAVLKLSAWGARELFAKNYAYKVQINWLPTFNQETMRQHLLHCKQMFGAQTIAKNKFEALPQRLWECFLGKAGINTAIKWSALPKQELNKLVLVLCAFELEVNGKTTYKDEFVTAGGVQLNEIDANTCKSKLHENLFFAGEIMNVDGITGGYNFQHAWTSGWLVAKEMERQSHSTK